MNAYHQAQRGRVPAGRTMPRLHGDDGASAVEFALIMPFFVMILFGIIEFGYVYGQWLDVRQGAREGARAAAVRPYDDTGAVTPEAQAHAIVQTTCTRMSLARGDTVVLTVGGTAKGDLVTVKVSRDVTQLTKYFNPLLRGRQFSSEVTMAREDKVSFVAATEVCP